MMNRRQIENAIIKVLSEILSQYQVGQAELFDDYTNHYFFFVKSEGDLKYKQFLRFAKSSYMWCDSNLYVYSSAISQLINSIDPNLKISRDYNGYCYEETEDFSILQIRLEEYTDPRNVGNVRNGFIWEGMYTQHLTIDNKPVNESMIPKIANEIFVTFFKPVFEILIPQTDTLSKIDSIINNFPQLKQTRVEPPILSVCFPYSQQLAMGLIVANYLDRADKKELTEKYLELASEYGEDSYGYTDLLFKAAKYFSKK